MSIEQTFVDVDKGKEALDTIKHYVKHGTDYPEFYHNFFTKWTLINPLYNACSTKKDCEPRRITDFGEKNENLWDPAIEDYTKMLVRLECVGEGKNDLLPNEYVRTATLHLRRELHITDDVCSDCRKKNTCDCSEMLNANFHKLDATIRILYQIRCNLFHGDKPELEGNQGERNKKLIKIGDRILTDILQNLADDNYC